MKQLMYSLLGATGAAIAASLAQSVENFGEGSADDNGVIQPKAMSLAGAVHMKTAHGMGGSSSGTVSAVAAIANDADTDSGIDFASGSGSGSFENSRVHCKMKAGMAGGSSGGLVNRAGNVPVKIENNNAAELTDNIELAALNATNNQYSGVTDVMRQ